MKCIISLILFVLCALINKHQFSSAMDNNYNLLETSYETKAEAESFCITGKHLSGWKTPAKDSITDYYVFNCKNNPSKKYFSLMVPDEACVELKSDGLFYCSNREYQLNSRRMINYRIKNTFFSSERLAKDGCIIIKKKLKRISLFTSEKWIKSTYKCITDPNKKYYNWKEAGDACVTKHGDAFICNRFS
ncbi:uncharacterized protein LOC122509511 [Leptopilina heterotoma]|uniref:uncharacterized protein LOC122509511 n=1 Tax=Leptopilina heterotoma TaxID=63436 RepID=UPI001CA9A259|nr:uncharacterized protein LOC122509511 [Leptopilina heterotoma]